MSSSADHVAHGASFAEAAAATKTASAVVASEAAASMSFIESGVGSSASACSCTWGDGAWVEGWGGEGGGRGRGRGGERLDGHAHIHLDGRACLERHLCLHPRLRLRLLRLWVGGRSQGRGHELCGNEREAMKPLRQRSPQWCMQKSSRQWRTRAGDAHRARP